MTTQPLVSISDFQQPEQTVHLPIDPDAEPLMVTFRPPELTMDLAARVKRALSCRSARAFWRHFCGAVVAWDVYGPVEAWQERDGLVSRVEVVPAGELVPLEVDVLQYVPTALGERILRDLARGDWDDDE